MFRIEFLSLSIITRKSYNHIQEFHNDELMGVIQIISANGSMGSLHTIFFEVPLFSHS